jgi:hypothetical protein
MAYQKIDLVGGMYHGRVCNSWAGEGVFPVWPEVSQRAIEFHVGDELPQTVESPRPVNYSVRHIRVNGWLFTFAAPADMPDEVAFQQLFPHGGRFVP